MTSYRFVLFCAIITLLSPLWLVLPLSLFLMGFTAKGALAFFVVSLLPLCFSRSLFHEARQERQVAYKPRTQLPR